MNARSEPHRIPLTALDFHVLIVLAREDLYGYAIMKAVEEESGGWVSPEIGSLYRVLARLMDEGLVAEAPAPPDAERAYPGRERRYYGVTERGREVARAEAGRLREVLELAREADLLPRSAR